LLCVGDDFGSAGGGLRNSKLSTCDALFCDFVCWMVMECTFRTSIDLSAYLL
jgi:hypothetical protein